MLRSLTALPRRLRLTPIRSARLLHWKATPNPLARELVLPDGKALLPNDTTVLRFQKRPMRLVDVVVPPVVDRLVTMPGVDEVLLSADRVTVNVEDGAKWDAVGPQVSQIVSEALQSGPTAVPESASTTNEELPAGKR